MGDVSLNRAESFTRCMRATRAQLALSVMGEWGAVRSAFPLRRLSNPGAFGALRRVRS